MDISKKIKIDKKINKYIDNQVYRYLLSEVTLCNVTITLFKKHKTTQSPCRHDAKTPLQYILLYLWFLGAFVAK